VTERLRSKYVFNNVALAGSTGEISIVAEFGSAEDRAMQTNSQQIHIYVNVTHPVLTYSDLRQAQSLLEAIFKPTTTVHRVADFWHASSH